ncbi:Lrp/AsnC ligand binding domain-containing protein [soil metagenome]
MTDRESLDGTDARILAALLRHPRATVMGLAGELSLARSTVQIRLARLEELGVLSMENVHAIPALAGYGVTAFMTIAVHQRDLGTLRDSLAAIPEVIEAYGTTGDGDVLCRVVARSAEDLGRVNALVLNCAGVRRASTSVVIRPVLQHRLTPLLGTVHKT